MQSLQSAGREAGGPAFAGRRPEAVVQRERAEAIRNSPRMLQQKALRDEIANSPRVQQQQALFERADDSPRWPGAELPATRAAPASAPGVPVAPEPRQTPLQDAWRGVGQDYGRARSGLQRKAIAGVVDEQRSGGEVDLAAAPAPIQRRTDEGIIQRLKKGDFAELGPFGLDVATWIEFADAVKGLSHLSLTMAAGLLAKREATNIDTVRAKLLVDKQRFKLKKPPQSAILDRYFPPAAAGPQTSAASAGHAQSSASQASAQAVVTIGDGVAETTHIRSASELLVWLISHPTATAKTPRSFADSPTLIEVLVKLSKEKRVVDPTEVWEALRAVIDGRPAREQADADEDEDDSDSDAEDQKGGSKFFQGGAAAATAAAPPAAKEKEKERDRKDEKTLPPAKVDRDRKDEADPEDPDYARWQDKAGEWGEGEHAAEAPLEFRRQMSEEQYQKGLQALAARLAGHKLVGAHATYAENVGSLVTQGVSSARFNTGHGAGKGLGFYIIPTPNVISSQQVLESVQSREKSAKFWGPYIVAVFLPDDCVCVVAKPGENVETLEQKHKGKKCYYEFGKREIVIPPSLCSQIILARDPADITMADPSLPAAPTKESALGFLQHLKIVKPKQAGGADVKQPHN